MSHAFRVVGLAGDGRALVEERESLTAPGGEETRYHLSAPDGAVVEVGQDALPPSLSLEPPGRFLVAQGTLPLTHVVSLPDLGALELRLQVGKGRLRTRGPELTLGRPGARGVVLWHLAQARPESARLYVAGNWLFAELSLKGTPSMLVRPVELHRAGARWAAEETRTALADGRLANAEATARAGLGLDPSRAELHFALAAALARQGRADEAMVPLRRALELDPRHLPGLARTSPDLDGLRGREDFDTLTAPMGRSAPP